MISKLNFYKDKRVFITGHTGFKGSWLALWLHNLGAEVTGYSLEPLHPNGIFELAKLKEKITHISGDIRNLELLKKSVAECKPDIIFHLAAQPLVRESYENPQYTFETNMMGTVNLLEAVRAIEGVQAICVITSDKCYRNKEWAWGYRESDELGGLDPYSASKSCAELIVDAYRHSYFQHTATRVVTARAGNVIGGGDWSTDRIIPDSVKALNQNQPILIRNPSATRPWQHVLEPLYGYLFLTARLIEDKKFEGAWNFGPLPEAVIPVKDLIGTFIKHWGSGKWTSNQKEVGVHEARLLGLDCSKAQGVLKWKPTLPVSEALRMTAEWYKRYSTEDVFNLCSQQIKEFTEKND